MTNSNFASTLNLGMALYHFHEWLFAEYEDQLNERFGAVASPGKFWRKVEESNRLFGFVHDVANASKHVELTRPPSTGMTHIENVQIVGGYGAGRFGEGRFGGSNVVCDDKGQPVFFDTCAKALFDYWRELLSDLTGKSYD